MPSSNASISLAVSVLSNHCSRRSVNLFSERESVWGLRVDEATFEAVRRDKQDDGIIENDRAGYKSRGHLQPRYDLPSSGGAITKW